MLDHIAEIDFVAQNVNAADVQGEQTWDKILEEFLHALVIHLAEILC